MTKNKTLLHIALLSIFLLLESCANTKKSDGTESAFSTNMENTIREFNWEIKKKNIYEEPDYYLSLGSYAKCDSCFIEIIASVSPHRGNYLYDNIQGYTYIDSTLIGVIGDDTACMSINHLIYKDRLVSFEDAMKIKPHKNYDDHHGLLIDDRIVWIKLYIHNKDSLVTVGRSI